MLRDPLTITFRFSQATLLSPGVEIADFLSALSFYSMSIEILTPIGGLLLHNTSTGVITSIGDSLSLDYLLHLQLLLR